MTKYLQIESNFKKASLFVAEGNYLAAIQIYKKLLEIEDAERSATIKLADIYDLLGKGESAIRLFTKYLDKNKDDEEVVRLVSFYMLRKSRFNEALKFVDNYHHISNENMDYVRGLLYFHTQQFEIAHLHFSNYISNYSQSELISSVYLYLAKIHYKYSEYDEALDIIKKANGNTDKIPEAYKVEADIYFEKEMYYHASESIRKAVKLNPTILEWRHLQIRILLMLGELSKAEISLKASIDNSLTSVELLTLLGHSYLKKEKVENARNYFQEALKINPIYNEALEGLKLCQK